MDNLKKYLQENSHQFGDDMPSKRIWKNVVNEINVDNTSSKNNVSPLIFIIFKYAVAACVIALAGIGVWHLSHQNANQQIVYVDSLNNKQVQVDSDYANVQSPDTPFTVLHSIATNTVENNISTDNSKENNNRFLVSNNTTNNNGLVQVRYVDSQFNQMISVQKSAINSTPIFTESPEYFKEFKVGYKQIEQDEKNIKQDISKFGFTDELLEQLININQHKLNLLKMLQTEINKTNIRFKQNRNQLDSAKMYYIEI
jgi:negative regulator of sigma E activity